MVDTKAVRENLDEWLQNPTWAEYYNGAPSSECRQYIALDFYASETEDEEVWNAMDSMLQNLGQESLKYLYDHAAGPEKAKLAPLLRK